MGDRGKGQGFGERHRKQIVYYPQDMQIGTVPPAVAAFNGYQAAAFTVNDDCVLPNFQMPDGYLQNIGIMVSFRWQISEAFAVGNAQVRFQFDWAATPADESEDLTAPTHTGTGNTGDLPVPAIQDALANDAICTIPGASLSALDSIGFTLTRIAAAGAAPLVEPRIIAVKFRFVELWPYYEKAVY